MTHLKRPLAKKNCTRGEYFTIPNGIINLNFLAVVVSEILRGSQIYTRRRCAPWMPPSGKNFCTQIEYFTISNCAFTF